MKRHIPLIFLFFISLLPLVDLAHPGLPVTHDGQDHVARIANFYQSLTDGNIVPRWAGNLNWGYGHPILMFLYPLPSYLASLFHTLGLSLVDSVKAVFAVSYVLSILLFYLWADAQWNRTAGVIGSLLYGFAPYRFVDLYVRGAIGEHLAFVFPPLICYGLLHLSRGEKIWSRASIVFGISGLILSHNAVSLMMLPIIGWYAWYVWNYDTGRDRSYLMNIWLTVVLGVVLAAFFWIPALYEGKYTLRDIVTGGDFSQRFVEPNRFFTGLWSYGGSEQLSKEIGLAQWLAIALGILTFIRMKNTAARVFVGSSLVILVLSLYLMTTWSRSVWETLTVLRKFQFPWRFLAVPVFMSAVIASFVIAHMRLRHGTIVGVILVFVALGSTGYMWHAKEYRLYDEAFFTRVYEGTTDTGESSPIWSVRFMEAKPNAPADVIDGQATITEVTPRFSTKHRYRIQAFSIARIFENTLYFPGWNVFIDGVKTEVEFQDPLYRGLMTFWVKPGTHKIDVVFGNTKVRTYASLVSIAGLVGIIGMVGLAVWEKK